MPALFGTRQAQRAKPGSLFSDRLLRRLVFGHRLLTFPHLFFFLNSASARARSVVSLARNGLSLWSQF